MDNLSSLFGHLATRFASHPENLATEALLYILKNTNLGNSLFTSYMSRFEDDFPKVTRFSSQVVSEENAIPDMVGTDKTGSPVIIVENKFWAELTPNQPLGYLPLLPNNGASALCFVCPQERIHVLNGELNRLVEGSGQYPKYENIQKSDDIIFNRVIDQKYLLVTSWRKVLADLKNLIDPIEERSQLDDLHQLNGLCEEMDQQGFFPLREHEIGNLEIPKRVLNYLDLIDAIYEELKSQEIATGDGLQKTSTGKWSGRYMNFRKKGEYVGRLALDFESWQKFGRSPIWLSFVDAEWGRGREGSELLAKFNVEIFELGGGCCLPVYLSPNTDRRKIIEDASHQIEEIVKILIPGT